MTVAASQAERAQRLFERRKERIEQLQTLLDRIHREPHVVLRQALEEQLAEQLNDDAEYAFTAREFVPRPAPTDYPQALHPMAVQPRLGSSLAPPTCCDEQAHGAWWQTVAIASTMARGRTKVIGSESDARYVPPMPLRRRPVLSSRASRSCWASRSRSSHSRSFRVRSSSAPHRRTTRAQHSRQWAWPRRLGRGWLIASVHVQRLGADSLLTLVLHRAPAAND